MGLAMTPTTATEGGWRASDDSLCAEPAAAANGGRQANGGSLHVAKSASVRVRLLRMPHVTRQSVHFGAPCT